MGFVTALLGAIATVGTIFKQLVAWFTKTVQERIESENKKLDKEIEDLKKTGRRTWKD
ncbi:hypothetical protein [Microcystis sp. M061S2]|uniref:hypothetical protein n=1 Tax=Microcystis sp. M061S2 TaxID=2771171 RepID=UPI002586860D|nr:hypothetical protein [Microcystis sp. M061S2]MCA2656369.1 hypothetical protein [Microcystis sp. M061S2]